MSMKVTAQHGTRGILGNPQKKGAVSTNLRCLYILVYIKYVNLDLKS
jgi:hypothetical protein